MQVRGFTYLWLLFIVAIGAALLAAIGQRWSSVMQREREHELLFRGGQIAAAISAYRAASGVPTESPRQFDDLLRDRRGPVLRRHLRRAWADPFTDEADWVPLVDDAGHWVGVRSRATRPAMLWPGGWRPSEANPSPRLSDHLFVAATAPAASAPAVTASAASAAAR